MARAMRWLASTTVLAGLFLSARSSRAQMETGHRALGTLGLDAGLQPDVGVYVVDQALFYNSSELIDRNGQSLPVGLDLKVFANWIGAAATFRLPLPSTYYNVSIGVPISSVSVNTERPEASLDMFGLADLYVQPVKLGWRAG